MSVIRTNTLIGVLACLIVTQAGDRAYSQVNGPAGAVIDPCDEAGALPRLHGCIRVIGEPPTFPPFVDCDCGDPVPDESVIVGPNGGLANCIVYLRQVPEDVVIPAAPEEPLIIELAGCRITPHVSLLRCGQTAVYRSVEGEFHSLHWFPFENPQFGHVASPELDQEASFDRPEPRPMPLGCDIHHFMSGYHMVLDHPWCAITDENGNFEISGLPEGELEFVAWHEQKGYIERSFTVQIEAGSNIERNFEVAASDLAN